MKEERRGTSEKLLCALAFFFEAVTVTNVEVMLGSPFAHPSTLGYTQPIPRRPGATRWPSLVSPLERLSPALTADSSPPSLSPPPSLPKHSSRKQSWALIRDEDVNERREEMSECDLPASF